GRRRLSRAWLPATAVANGSFLPRDNRSAEWRGDANLRFTLAALTRISQRADMSLNVAVQMDPIERINIRGDSTFALLLEAQARGHRLSYYMPDRMAMVQGEVFSTVRPLAVRDKAGDHFTLSEGQRVPLASFDVVLLRQDPPFDMNYI